MKNIVLVGAMITSSVICYVSVEICFPWYSKQSSKSFVNSTKLKTSKPISKNLNNLASLLDKYPPHAKSNVGYRDIEKILEVLKIENDARHVEIFGKWK